MTTNYLVDPTAAFPAVVEERDGGNSLIARYDWGAGGELIRRVPFSGSAAYAVLDGLGSVRALATGGSGGSGGTISDTWSYDAWGVTTRTSGSTANPFLFNGQQQDATGLYYLRARYYAPTLARFLTVDPFNGEETDSVTLHRYIYAGDDPSNNVDPEITLIL